jgi:TRAP transporter 4TM/12TM fusion protein
MTSWFRQDRPSVRQAVIAIVALALAVFHLYTASFGLLSPQYQRGTHLIGLLALAFLGFPTAGGKRVGQVADWTGFAAIVVLAAYLFTAYAPDLVRERGIMGPSRHDIWAGVLLIALVLEGTRRAIGLPIVLVAATFVLYGYFGGFVPDLISHRGYSIERLTTYLVWTTEGVFGTPIAVSASFVIIFIIFGSLLNRLGAGALFINLAMALTGRIRGGPALTAVLGSALMGSINGSSVSNVVTTGTFTIPLMRRSGYTPLFAGGVEAVASTGGQIMPPIMGAGAFVMAEMMGIPYSQVALAALIPAVLYFVSIMLMVYLEANRRDIPVLSKEERPAVGPVLKRDAHLLLPLCVLVYFLVVERLSPMISGLYGIGSLVLVSSLATLIRERRLPLAEIIGGLREGVTTAVPVALACASAGIVIGIVALTGLGVRFTQLIVDLSSGILWAGAALTMIACIILGMGLPTTAAYIITAVLGAPALISLGVEPIAAHMFIFYFAIISFITPPVGLSAYAAAGIAGTNPMETSVSAFRLGIAGFIVPFAFIYSPALLLAGDVTQIMVALLTALLGVASLAAASVGWLFAPLPLWARTVFLAGAILLIVTDGTLVLAGAVPLIIAALLAAWRHRPATPDANAGVIGIDKSRR